jgi:hypothetical protein
MGDTSDEPVESDEEIIQRELDENGVDAERALAVLIDTIVARHVDCAMRMYGKRPKWTPGNERLNALTAAIDALFQQSTLPGQATFDTSPRSDLPDDDAINVRRMLIRLLGQIQFAAEKRAGLGDDDDDEPPKMRLVTD